MMDEVTMLQLVALTLAIVEGVKVAYNGFTGKVLNKGMKIIVSVLVPVSPNFQDQDPPDVWLRVVPILTVGLAAAGLYSIGKRSGSAVVNSLNGNK